ncbi:uncharacterized protein LOC134209926 [Armigeres subalbatus]|uniref:uncharacterized protein LOC134209926 n=1 Tax=Armigeres subalbatus TaxID=124917 RepID=UPI002ED46953
MHPIPLSRSTRTYIDDLPVEIMDRIMSYLPLADRKSASLVCYRWSELAFSFCYLANVRLRLKEQEMMMKLKIVDVLQNSWRSYRNVALDFGNSGVDVVLILVILSKFSKSIEVFGTQPLFTPWQLKEMLQRMPKLKQLTVNVISEGECYVKPHEFPVMEDLLDIRTTDAIFDIPDMNALKLMPSVQNLSVYFQRNVTANAFTALCSVSPQLKTLEVFADFSRSPIELLNLQQLDTLKLWGTNAFINNDSLKQLFMGIPLLSVLFLHVRMTTSLLEVICSHCPRLTSFGFIADRMDQMSLCALHKLKNLKILLIDGCLKYYMIHGCKPLPTVDTFCMYWHKKHIDLERFVKQLHYMLPNVRILKVIGTRSKQMDNPLIHHIGRLFTKVKKLTVADFVFPREIRSPDECFDWVANLGNVEQLILSTMRLKNIDCLRGSDKVRKLKLEHLNYLPGNSLVLLASLFPRLKSLKINRCALITAKDIKTVQRMMPKCTMGFVERKR